MSIFNFSNPISQWQFQNPYLFHKQAHPEQKNSVFLILSLCVMIPVLVTIIAGISILLFIYLAVLVILKPEMVSVRWGRGLPTPSLSPLEPHGENLGVQLYPSHCRADSGLSPVRTCARRAHMKLPAASCGVSARDSLRSSLVCCDASIGECTLLGFKDRG